MLKPSLIITALAPIVFGIAVVLHNLISAWLGVEEPLFFFVAVVVAPLAFVIGLVASIVALVTERRGDRPAHGVEQRVTGAEVVGGGARRQSRRGVDRAVGEHVDPTLTEDGDRGIEELFASRTHT